MKMPTTTDIKVKMEPKGPMSIDLESEIADLEFEDAGRQCVTFLEKKMRNLEKRKKKMELNRERALKGEKLEKEAQLSIEQYDLLAQDLRFARELHKQFLSINEQNEESVKKMAKKEIKRIEEILNLQYTLDQLGGDHVRQDFITGKHGAVVLTQDNLDQLDALYQAISPTRESQEKDDVYAKKLYTAADHLVNFLDGEDSQVVGTTYKELRELVTLINGCGYFEQANLGETQEKPTDQEKEVSNETEEVNTEIELSTEEPEPASEQTPEESVESADNIAQSLDETQTQPLNTLEQDAFFAPSSSPYQTAAETTPFSSQSANSTDVIAPKSSLPDIQSFTHNRPFQFIQTSYVMPDVNSPSVVDPAVIAAQPAGAHGLQFMSPIYDSGVVTSSSVVQQSHPQPQHQQSQQPQPPQQHPSHQPAPTGNSLLSSQQSQATPSGVNALGMPVDLSQAPVDLSQSGVKQQQTAVSAQDFNVQTNFPQPESLFPSQPVGHEDLSTSSLPGHSDSRSTSLREDTISSLNYDIPPSIPMPPSQTQDPTQVEPQEKKSPMNANAPVFQSMYAQGMPNQVNMPPPSVSVGVSSDIPVPPSQSEFVTSAFGGPSGDFVGNRDFQYQGNNGFPNGNYGRGPGGNRGYRSSRGGGSAGPNNSVNNRNGGSPLQNGFGPRGSPTNTNNSRGARGGGSYQTYGGPNAGYRSDSFQTGGYGSSSFGNTNNYSKRGGMNSNMGPGNSGGYPPRPTAMGNNTSRGGAMRGGLPRGGPRGAPRGFSRP